MTITLMIATIDVEPGWAVGTVPLSDPAIDRELLLDSQGQPWVPGSSLAGSLRAHLAAAQPPADTRLMGSRPPHDQAGAAGSTVSAGWHPTPPGGAATSHDDVRLHAPPPEGARRTRQIGTNILFRLAVA